MIVDNKKQDKAERKSSDGSQNTCNSGDLEEDQKTFQMEVTQPEEQHNPEHYPAVLEYAPFPALGSLEEISQTLSRVKSNQTQKSFHNDEKNNAFTTEYIKEDNNAFKQEAYYTDGIRNPGWLTVLSCFLVNFFVFGSCFSWGIYQKL